MHSDENSPEITNNLLLFHTKTNNWKNIEATGSIPMSGHAAVVVHGTMYVFFGYNKDHVFLDRVQKLKLSKLNSNLKYMYVNFYEFLKL